MDLHPYYPLLARTPLLRGMRPDELDTLLDCFAPVYGAMRGTKFCC